MEEKKVTKINLLIFFLILAVITIIMGIFMYKLYSEKIEATKKLAELQIQVNNLNETVSNSSIESQKNLNHDNFDELYTIRKIDIYSRDYDEHKANNDNNVLYDFKSKKWCDSMFESYYLAVDGKKELYIVDATENIISKLNIKLGILDNYSYSNANGQVIKYQIDNYITYARVSKLQNILEIQTGDDFITYIVDLENFSTKLAEITDD